MKDVLYDASTSIRVDSRSRVSSDRPSASDAPFRHRAQDPRPKSKTATAHADTRPDAVARSAAREAEPAGARPAETDRHAREGPSIGLAHYSFLSHHTIAASLALARRRKMLPRRRTERDARSTRSRRAAAGAAPERPMRTICHLRPLGQPQRDRAQHLVDADNARRVGRPRRAFVTCAAARVSGRPSSASTSAMRHTVRRAC